MKNLYLSSLLKHAAIEPYRAPVNHVPGNTSAVREAGQLIPYRPEVNHIPGSSAGSRYAGYGAMDRFAGKNSTAKAGRFLGRLGSRGKIAAGLFALGGSAYGGHKASQAATARRIENMPLLERLAAAGLLAFNPSSFGDRLRG